MPCHGSFVQRRPPLNLRISCQPPRWWLPLPGRLSSRSRRHSAPNRTLEEDPLTGYLSLMQSGHQSSNGCMPASSLAIQESVVPYPSSSVISGGQRWIGTPEPMSRPAVSVLVAKHPTHPLRASSILYLFPVDHGSTLLLILSWVSQSPKEILQYSL